MKRAIALILLFFVIISGRIQIPFVQPNLGIINYYKDIPGITDDEILAIEKLKEKYTSFSYGHIEETEAFLTPDGSYAGFIYSFAGLLTDLFGISFIPHPKESWNSLKSSFDNKQIDFISDLTATPERLKEYYMTHAIAERSLRIFTLANDGTIVSEADIENRKIGVLSGTVTNDAIRKAYPYNFITVELSDNADAVRKLEEGLIDAFVMEAIIDPAFKPYKNIMSRDFFPLVYSPVSLSAVKPELEPIISVVNKYLKAGGIDVLYELYKEGENEYIKIKLEDSLSDEEKSYINQLKESGRKVSLALEHDNYPVCFYNEKDDEFQGIAVDVINEISRISGLEFEVKTDKDTPWSDIFEQLRTGEISMVSQLLYSDARKDSFIWSSIPYSSSYYALISKYDYPNMEIYQIIRAKVGNIEKTAFEDIYNEWFPDSSNSVRYETQNAALDALEFGEVDLLMASDYILLTQLNYREKSGYKVNIRFNEPMYSLFGFNKQETILCSIVDKTQAYIKTNNIARDWESRVFDYSKKYANDRVAYLAILSIILLIVLFSVVILLLNNKRLSKNLEQQTLEAQVASKAKGAFLANMSHEIRTPLNAIIGMAGIALNSIGNTEKMVSSINQIITSSNHLLKILNNVLDMSKIDSGKLELINEPFSLLDAYEELSVIITQRCYEKDICFKTNISEMPDYTLMGDKLRINQVLINLLGNAVKFTGKGGMVELNVVIIDEYEDSIRFGFTVSDNGIGMTQDQQSKLFRPFEQADSTITTKYGGTGLGLSISYSLVQMMGGEISVESEVNVGTKFYFELYFKAIKENIVRTPKQTGELDLTGKRILLVEDIEINRIIINEILEPTRVEIIEAIDGKQALDIFESSPQYFFDLIFMDIQMPVMDGYESTVVIRALERDDSKSIPIIAMTANAYKEDADAALHAGMNGHLSKPVDYDALMKMLSDYLKIENN